MITKMWPQLLSFIFLSCSSLRAELVRLDSVCDTGAARYECNSTNGGIYLDWELRLPNGEMSYLSLNSETYLRGSVTTRMIGSTVMEYGLISSSVLRGTLNIRSPLSVNGTRISCGGASMVLIVLNHNISLFPDSIKLTPSMLSNKSPSFIMGWIPLYHPGTLEYSIVLTSPLSTAQFATANSSIDVSSAFQLRHTVVMTATGCAKGINADFTMGGCSYLVDNSVFSVDHYIVNSSSHFTVVIRCEADNNNYESYTVGCGRNGEWEMDITSVCHDPYSSTVVLNNATTITTSSIIDGDDLETRVDLSLAVFIVVILTSIICGCLFALIIGLFGFLFWKKRRGKQEKCFNNLEKSFTEVNQTNKTFEMCEIPVYEEVPACIPVFAVSQNAAYECLKKHNLP